MKKMENGMVNGNKDNNLLDFLKTLSNNGYKVTVPAGMNGDYDGDLPFPGVMVPPTEARVDMTPAVTFDGFNIYTTDGNVTTVPATIYNKIADINSVCLNETMNNLSVDTALIDDRTICNIATATLNSTVRSFLFTVDNLYGVFLAKLNSLFKINGQNNAFVHNINITDGNRVIGFMPFFYSLTQIDREHKSFIINDRDKLINFTITFMNELGLVIYNDARKQLTDIIIDNVNVEGPSPIVDMFGILDGCFSSMMGDITYEASLFIDNFNIAQPLFPEASKIDKLRGLDNCNTALEYGIF